MLSRAQSFQITKLFVKYLIKTRTVTNVCFSCVFFFFFLVAPALRKTHQLFRPDLWPPLPPPYSDMNRLHRFCIAIMTGAVESSCHMGVITRKAVQIERLGEHFCVNFSTVQTVFTLMSSTSLIEAPPITPPPPQHCLIVCKPSPTVGATHPSYSQQRSPPPPSPKSSNSSTRSVWSPLTTAGLRGKDVTQLN